jgi:hypothetical protein
LLVIGKSNSHKGQLHKQSAVSLVGIWIDIAEQVLLLQLWLFLFFHGERV